MNSIYNLRVLFRIIPNATNCKIFSSGALDDSISHNCQSREEQVRHIGTRHSFCIIIIAQILDIYTSVYRNMVCFVCNVISQLCVLKFIDMKVLDLTHNQIAQLPKELGFMRSLEQLYIRHNKLKELPLLENCANLKVRMTCQIQKMNVR